MIAINLSILLYILLALLGVSESFKFYDLQSKFHFRLKVRTPSAITPTSLLQGTTQCILPSSMTQLFSTVSCDSSVLSPRNRRFEQVIHGILNSSHLALNSLTWHKEKLEVTLLNPTNATNSCPTMDELAEFQRSLYTVLESDTELDAALVNLEIVVSSPGLSDVLTNDRDFVSFQGFEVEVHMSELFSKKMQLQGRLMKRTEDCVVLSLKGRIVNVPREIITLVKLPPPIYED